METSISRVRLTEHDGHRSASSGKEGLRERLYEALRVDGSARLRVVGVVSAERVADLVSDGGQRVARVELVQAHVDHGDAPGFGAARVARHVVGGPAVDDVDLHRVATSVDAVIGCELLEVARILDRPDHSSEPAVSGLG